MSRWEPARRSGLNINTVCKLTNDDNRLIDLETLNQICAVMEIKPDDILTNMGA